METKSSRNTFGFIALIVSIVVGAIGLWADVVDLGFLSPPANNDPIILTVNPASNSENYGSTTNIQPQNPTEVQSHNACADNGLSPRLQIGDTGRVLPDPPQHNLLRYQPNKNSEAFERIETGKTFTVLDGPICADNIYWWKVKSYEGVIGWTSEGDDGIYYLESLD